MDISAALEDHENSHVRNHGNGIYWMDLFSICQQAYSNSPYMYFSYSVAYPKGFPSEYSIIAAFWACERQSMAWVEFTASQ